jgi:hypothetical protein
MSYVVVFFMFSVLRSEMIIRFVDISGIVDHQCLNFFFIKHLQKISVFPQNIEVYWWPLHISIKMLAIVLVKIHYLIHSKLLIYILTSFMLMVFVWSFIGWYKERETDHSPWTWGSVDILSEIEEYNI